MKFFQCLGDLVTEAFQKRNPCENVTSPCWIPQAQNIVDRNILTALPMCDTLQKYTCMLKTIKDAKYASPSHCQHSCTAEGYKVLSRTADIEPFTRVKYWLFRGTKYLYKVSKLMFDCRKEGNGILFSAWNMQATQNSTTKSVWSTTWMPSLHQ